MPLEPELSEVGLAQAIAQVRSELEDALDEGQGSQIAFRSGPVELEFALEFRSTGSADAGVKVYVLSFGAKGEVSSASTSRLKVTLQPVNRVTLEDTVISSEHTQ